MMDPVELDCFELKQAVKGLGTDEETLFEILASRSNDRIRAINETYQKSLFQITATNEHLDEIYVYILVYSKALEKDVKSDTSGNFRRLLISLLQGKRPETTEVNVEQAKQDAQSLLDAGQAKFGTDESKFNVLLCDRSDPQLRAIFDEYAKSTGKSIGKPVDLHSLRSSHFCSLQRKPSKVRRVVTSRKVCWPSFGLFEAVHTSLLNSYAKR